MRINKLLLENFQGIKRLELNPYGSDVVVRGDNATGKSTIGNGITWLLYGKALDGTKNYSPKPQKDGVDVHGVNTLAEMEIDHNGAIMTLTRAIVEKTKNARGNAENVEIKNETECAINGVPVKVGEFEKRIADICPPDLAKILTNPLYFAQELPWQERRTMLLDICGDVTDQEVIAANADLADLLPRLKIGTTDQNYTINEYQDMVKAAITRLNKEKDEIPNRIDEVKRMTPETKGLTKKALNAEIKAIESQITENQERLTLVTKDSALEALRVEKHKISGQISENQYKFEATERERTKEARETIANLKDQIQEKSRELNTKKREKADTEEHLSLMEKARAAIIETYNELKAQTFDPEKLCPVCGQEYPKGKIEEQREEFNKRRSERATKINAKAQAECSKDMVNALKLKIEAAEKKITEAEAEIKEMTARLEVMYEPEVKRYEDTPEYAELTQKKADLEAKINSDTVTASDAATPINAEIAELKQQIDEKKNLLAQIDQAKIMKDRVKELETSQKEILEKLEDAEYGRHLCGEFVKAKVRMLTDAINSNFETVQFKLFHVLQNGNVEERCEALVGDDNIEFFRANNAGKINAGIEIINAITKYVGIEMPLVVDNAESVVDIHSTNSQMICLVVDGKCKDLKFETISESERKVG